MKVLIDHFREVTEMVTTIEIEVKHEQSVIFQRKNGLANAERLFSGTGSGIPFWLRCRRYIRERQVQMFFHP